MNPVLIIANILMGRQEICHLLDIESGYVVLVYDVDATCEHLGRLAPVLTRRLFGA